MASPNTPVLVAQEFMSAVRTRNVNQFCALVVPQERQECQSAAFATAMRSATISDVAIHQTVVSGDRALVSITGKLCIAGQCHGATDPNVGMPSSTVTFDQAWAKAVGPTPTAGSPLEKINGKWYIILD